MNCSNCGKTFWRVEIEETVVESSFEMESLIVKTKQFTCCKCGLRWYSSDLVDSFPDPLEDN